MTVYILLEKILETGIVRVAGVYASYDLAEETMEELMSVFEEERSYKIEDKYLED